MAMELLSSIMSGTPQNEVRSPHISENCDHNLHFSYSFDRLLSDSDGVKLFTNFLCSHCSSGHLLDFWFACKGFRSKVSTLDPDKAFQVAKIIYRTYVKSGAEFAVPLSSSLKHEIVSRLNQYHRGCKYSPSISTAIMRSLFDVAQDTIHSILEFKFYPLFLEYLKTDGIENLCSHEYYERAIGADLIQSALEYNSPNGQTHINSSDFQFHLDATPRFVRPTMESFPIGSYPLPDTSSHSVDPRMYASCMTAPLARKSHYIGLSERNSFRLYIGVDNLLGHSSGDADSVRHRTELRSNEVTTRLDHPPQHHDLSVSSGINHSPTPPPAQRNIRLPHTNRPYSNPPTHRHKARADQSLAETDPASFANLLNSRLEQIKESRSRAEKLLSRVGQVEDKGLSRAKVASTPTQLRRESEGTSADVLAYDPCSSSSNELSSMTASMTVSNLLCQRHILLDYEDDPQGILDEHCSRIWSDEHPKSINRFSSKTDRQSTCRRRCSSRINSTKVEKIDTSSVYSRDSGVTDPSLNAVPHSTSTPSEADSKSIVAAASLQALTSSLTDLAVMNNEVTSQLIQQMARKLQKTSDQHSISAHSDSKTAHTSIQAPNQTNPLDRRGYSLTNEKLVYKPYVRFPSGYNPQLRHRASTTTSKTGISVTSDSSTSPFDSGISSTYDHLPAYTSLANEKPIHNPTQTYYPKYNRSPSHPPIRSSSSHGACCHIGRCQHLHTLTPTWFSPAHLQTPSANPIEMPQCIGTGHLLHHWLRWQSDDPSDSSVGDQNVRQKSTIDERRRSMMSSSRPTMVQSMGPMPFNRCMESSEGHMNGDMSQLQVTATSSSGGQQQQPHLGLIVGYYLCDDPVPYRTVWVKPSADTESDQPGTAGDTQSLTLGQFKQLIAKKGIYRYFFKKPSDEFGSGAVHEELTEDDSILPLWEGKVVARIERAE